MTDTLERKLARRRIANRVDEVLPLQLSKQTPALEVRPGPIGKPDGPGLWRVKGMGFPPYFQNVRNALIRNGHSVASASMITWGAIRRWARGGGNVHPEVRTAARRALASIASKEARAHAQAATHAHTTLRDQLVLREFARSGVLAFADPYHAAAGSGQGGQFTSASNAGAGGAASASGTTKGGPSPKPISPQQRAKYLKIAAQDTAKAQQLRAEAAKINLQIAALAVLIAQQQKYLATSATGATTQGTGAQTGQGANTQTKTQAQTATAAGTQAQTANFNPYTTQQMLAQNQAQMKQLVATRDALLKQATQLDQQAAYYTQLAKG